MPNTETLLVKGATFYAYHGATQAQINQGQRFIMDAEVELDMSEACREDHMAPSLLDCAELYDILREMTTERRYNLMQVLALETILEIKKRHPEVRKVTVGACKASCVMWNDCKGKPGGNGIVEDRIGVTLTRIFD